MQCSHPTPTGISTYLQLFREKVASQRVPLSGSIELTRACNLKCLHCYLAPDHSGRSSPGSETATPRLLSILDEVAEAGCLFLIMTGGEPLLRPDFPAVYRRAKDNGLLVSIFSNGTLITEEILDLFSDLPPHKVEISLYGATERTHEGITRVEGSYRRCLDGVEALLERGMNLEMKTILMTLNRHELSAMEQMAGKYGVPFRFDAAIYPRFDGDRTPMDLRVPPEEAVEMELADGERQRQWTDYFREARHAAPSYYLYSCGAGLNHFHIDPFARLQPCLMARGYRHDLSRGSFHTGWREVISQVREARPGGDYPCNDCENRVICGICPPFFDLENGTEDLPSAYVCAMGRHRFQMISEGNEG